MKLKFIFCIFLSILLFSCEKEEITYEEGSSISYDGEIDGYGYVDLGLPSGLRWATHNIGASLPIESGDRFAWGEISTKNNFEESNCKTYGKRMEDFSNNIEYDAATYNWSKKWRVPTHEEIFELINNCSWNYVEISGIPCIKLTSRINGKTILFPFTDSRGRYWTSTPGYAEGDEDNENHEYAYQFNFDEGDITTKIYWYVYRRCVGASIRPVSTKPVDISGEIEGHEYVDLGLSVKWATCNVGASLPEEYGDFFKWGRILPVSGPNNDFPDNIMAEISGNINYDAATANWGGSWRMPTMSELQELVDNCRWSWKPMNGCYGYVGVSKKTGKSIFLPAAGHKFFSNGEIRHFSQGEYGHYWSGSSLVFDDGQTIVFGNLYFKEEWAPNTLFDTLYDDHGISIRPVSD